MLRTSVEVGTLQNDLKNIDESDRNKTITSIFSILYCLFSGQETTWLNHLDTVSVGWRWLQRANMTHNRNNSSG